MQTNCKSFKALGIMLCYPEKDWCSNVGRLIDTIHAEKIIASDDALLLQNFANMFASADIMDLQEQYVELFDRSKSLSLHLFEHVHGDSRDRGQAMVDLTNTYQVNGFDILPGELPDFLPLFLEFLSLVPRQKAIEMLSEASHIYAAIAARLQQRESVYSSIFEILARLGGEVITKPDIVKTDKAISLADIDKEWEEAPVSFMGSTSPEKQCKGGGGCSNCKS